MTIVSSAACNVVRMKGSQMLRRARSGSGMSPVCEGAYARSRGGGAATRRWRTRTRAQLPIEPHTRRQAGPSVLEQMTGNAEGAYGGQLR